MRDPKRIEQLLERLKKVWLQYPDMRLGQLVECGAVGHDTFYVEDEKLIEEIERLIKDETTN